ncbi:hypothetical protein [Streptomyces sp. 7-21]|jgi:hypothetical protein|uniref:hypothetical protein n=1 Tax=Streptomyces sp. 7-21 TaxID=2802283 RepID=UPI00191CA275|nr:hypothetical protein [Streptomyces sp. 7-21]MBL1067475.1 hypothetical protein [Streptomyces sp. 7-21]
MKSELSRPTTTPLADPAMRDAVADLVTHRQAPVSDAPLYAPEATGALLLGLLLTPKEPKEPKTPRKV